MGGGGQNMRGGRNNFNGKWKWHFTISEFSYPERLFQIAAVRATVEITITIIIEETMDMTTRT